MKIRVFSGHQRPVLSVKKSHLVTGDRREGGGVVCVYALYIQVVKGSARPSVYNYIYYSWNWSL